MRKIAALVTIIIYIFMLSSCTSNGENTTGYSDKATKKTDTTSTSKNSTVLNKTTNEKQETEKTEEAKMPVTLYYQDKGGFVVPVTFKIPKTLSIARTVVGELTDNEKSRDKLSEFGLIPVLPQGTVLKSINIEAGTAMVDFNLKFTEAKNATAERNAVVSLVYSLTELKTIKNINILIEGKQYGKLKYGTDISGLLDRTNILINSGTANVERGMAKYDAFIYRIESDKIYYLIPVSKELDEMDIKSKLSAAVEFMSKKFYEGGLFTEIPAGTRIIGCLLKDGVLTVNVNDAIKSYGGGNSREAGLIDQVLYCLKQIEGVKSVKILIDGKQATLPEGTEISSMALPQYINEINN